MEALVSWVQSMLAEGFVPVEIRVGGEHAGALALADIIKPKLIKPPVEGEAHMVAFRTATDTYYAVLVQ